MHSFSYILTEHRSKYSVEMKVLQQTHDPVESIDCFSSIGLQYQSMFPVKVKTKSCIDIFKRKENPNDKFVIMREKLVHKLEDIPKVAVEMDHGTPIDTVGNTPIELTYPTNDINILEPYIEIEDDIDIIKDITEVTNLTNEQTENDVIVDQTIEQNVIKTEEKPVIDSEETIDNDESVQKKDNEPKMKHSPIRKPKKMRSKLKDLIESHYRSKGSIIETDHKEDLVTLSMPIQSSPFISAKTNIKRIIKAEKIKDLVDRISKLDLTKHCDLEALSTKDCLKKIIDEYDIEPDRL